MNRGDAYKLLVDELAECELSGYSSLVQRVGKPAVSHETFCGGEQITIETRIVWADSHHRLIRICAVALVRRRMEHVLSAAVINGQTALVLGAWGCGAFGNDPEMVAGPFAQLLLGTGQYAHAFEHVEFAVLDRQGETIAPFTKRFG